MILDKKIQQYYEKREYTLKKCLLIKCIFCNKNLQFFEYFDNEIICDLIIMLEKKQKRTNAWDEDEITSRIIDIFLDYFEENELIDNINIYKQRGNMEKKFGDIAFVITFHQPNGTFFHGVSFIEAKRDFPEKDYTFDSFKKEQLQRIIKHTTSSFYLFYSHKYFLPVIDSFCLNQIVEKNFIKNGKLKVENFQNHYTTLPIQIDRYLRGFDLDYSKQAQIIAQGNGKNIGNPKYIVKIDINNEGFHPEPTNKRDNPPPFNPNNDIYKKLRDDKISKKEKNEENNNSFGMNGILNE